MEQALKVSRQGNGQQRAVFPDVRRTGSLGVLYSLECQKDVRELFEMVKWIREKGLESGVLAIENVKCFKDDAQRSAFVEELEGGGTGVTFVGRKQLDWIGVPQQGAAADFLKQRFDLLVVMNDSGCFALEYLALKADAAFVVGIEDCTAGHCREPYNMVLARSGKNARPGKDDRSAEGGATPVEYLQQLFDYLESMNREPEE